MSLGMMHQYKRQEKNNVNKTNDIDRSAAAKESGVSNQMLLSMYGNTVNAPDSRDTNTLDETMKARISQIKSGAVRREVPGDMMDGFEQKFEVPLDGVEVYENKTLDTLAPGMAFAQGNEIHMSGPVTSPAGRQTLMHEMTHVVQQGRGLVSGQGLVENQTLEHQADLGYARAGAGFSMPASAEGAPVQGLPGLKSFFSKIFNSSEPSDKQMRMQLSSTATDTSSNVKDLKKEGAASSSRIASTSTAGTLGGGRNYITEHKTVEQTIKDIQKAKADCLAKGDAVGADNADEAIKNTEKYYAGNDPKSKKGKAKGKNIIANRNEGMTKLANLLGIGDVIAQSSTQEVSQDGRVFKADVMEGVEGDEAAKAIESLGSGGSRAGMNFDSSSITGNLQKQLMSLQVLDLLGANTDRHLNNFMLQSSTGENNTVKFDSLKGIDNDQSFYKGGDVNDVKGNSRGLISKDPNYGGGNDISGLPLISRQLAVKLVGLQGSDIRKALKGTITDKEELDNTVKRFEQLKKHVVDMDDKDFLEDDQWGEESLNKLMARQGFDTSTDGRFAYGNTSNYVEKLVQGMGAARSGLKNWAMYTGKENPNLVNQSQEAKEERARVGQTYKTSFENFWKKRRQ